MVRSYDLSEAEEAGLQGMAKAAGDTPEKYFAAVVGQLMRDCVRQVRVASEAALTDAVKKADPAVQADIQDYIVKKLGLSL